MSKSKPTMKAGEVSETIATPVKICLDWDPERFSNGFLHMAITSVTVKKDLKPVGEVTVNVQGTAVHMRLEGSGRTWSIHVDQLIPLFLEADKRYQEAK